MNEKKEDIIETLSVIVEDVKVFESHGYSIVKVTKDGVEKKVKVKIKSTGVHEFIQQQESKAPRPPVIMKHIRKKSPEGRERGLGMDISEQVFDYTDEDYVDAFDKYQTEMLWNVAAFAIDIPLEKKDGTIADTIEEKKTVIKSSGITNSQIQKIFEDVNALTKFREDQEDFLSENDSE